MSKLPTPTYYNNMTSRLSYTTKNSFWVSLSTFKYDQFFHTRCVNTNPNKVIAATATLPIKRYVVFNLGSSRIFL